MAFGFGKRGAVEMRDISAQTFGKYQHCTSYEGVFYADEDFDRGFGMGKPKPGSIPSPSEEDRTPFGQKRKPKEPEAAKAARLKDERERAHEELERLAKEASAEVVAQQDELADAFRQEHERDLDGYSFNCRRFGDFLTLEVERKANPAFEPDSFWRVDRSFATTVNLGLVSQIHLIEGHCADRKGEVGFRFNIEHTGPDGEWRGSSSGTGMGNYLPKDGHFKVWAELPRLAPGRPIFVADPPKDDRQGMIWLDSGVYQIVHCVPGTARPAKDDEVRFEGLGATLYVPAGQGRGVLDQILEEIARGCPTDKPKAEV